MISHAEKFRARLSQSEVCKVPGVFDALSALMVERAEFHCAFLSGACVAFSRFGRPDLGLVTASEMTAAVASIRERVEIPLLVDMDTGFGNALNVQRTVRMFETAGASGLQMEDQVMPKRCGHMAGKQVISCAEMVGKIKAALDARVDAATVLIARTDALGVEGLEAALDRAECYLEAGADALFVEAPRTREEMDAIAARFAARVPLVHNLVEGGASPIRNADGLSAMGYKIALYPTSLLNACLPVARDVLDVIQRDGESTAFAGEMFELNDINELVGTPAMLAQGKRYQLDD